MTIQSWWPKLLPDTRKWLIANNGDAVSPSILDEIAAVGGPSASDPWWESQEGTGGRCMPDEAIDWIEEIANDEPTGE